MLRERARILLVDCSLGLGLLGLATLSCGGRSGLVVRTDGGRTPGPGGSPQVLPLDDGSCPATTSLCGTGPVARCYALDSDAMNCGACGRACTPGVACSAGSCKQSQCTGPASFQQIASFPSSLATRDPTQFMGYVGADMNRDGRLDLIEYNQGGDLMIWLGHGDGTFAASTSYSTLDSFGTWALPGYAAVGDFNEDGLADLAVTRPGSETVEIRPGISGGGLGGHPGLPVSRLVMADLDGDGHLDVIEGHINHDQGENRFTVLRGRGNGTFAKTGDYAIPDDLIARIQLRDWDGNGTLDLLAVGTTLHVLPGKGDGTFAELQHCALGVDFQTGVFPDLNLDGKLDAVWAMWPNQSLATVLGSGDCRFSPRTDYPESFQPWVLGIGDLSGDGVLDLVLPGDKGRTLLLIGKGDGTFVAEPELALDMSGLALFIADVTDDGVPDIVSTGERGIVVFANTCAH